MLVKELDVAIVNTLCNLLSNLMRRPALNHIQPRPTVLSLCSGRRANEEIVLELTLKAILFDVIS
jgi:hypothetical protein